jgi:hypothetical protein
MYFEKSTLNHRNMARTTCQRCPRLPHILRIIHYINLSNASSPEPLTRPTQDVDKVGGADEIESQVNK